MARLILHARYFASNAKKRQGRLSYLVKYYGTREGIEKPQAEEWKKNPVTEKQDELIQKHDIGTEMNREPVNDKS